MRFRFAGSDKKVQSSSEDFTYGFQMGSITDSVCDATMRQKLRVEVWTRSWVQHSRVEVRLRCLNSDSFSDSYGGCLACDGTLLEPLEEVA